jgi:tRNA(Ile)-lysidine synthase
MLEQFKSYVARHSLLDDADSVLAAVSGGVDSMALLHLLLAAGYSTGVAHCNFRLRGEESDGDERMLRECCHRKNIPFLVARFDTSRYAAQKGISIQMAARELRYAWLESVAAEQGFGKIAVAHNANDEVETFLLNLVRGTGLRGLAGMAAKRGKIVRPLLFASRTNILQYAQEHGLSFREDSSNRQLKYARNRIRMEVIPELAKINPAFLATMQGNMERLGAAQRLVAEMADGLRKKACTAVGSELHIKISALPDDNLPFWLFELLYEFGFSGATVGDVAEALRGISGKIFYSPTHRLLKNRTTLIVLPREREAPAAQTGSAQPNGMRREVAQLQAPRVKAPQVKDARVEDAQQQAPRVKDAPVQAPRVQELLIPAALIQDAVKGCKVELGCAELSFTMLGSQNVQLNQGSSVALLDYDALQFPLKLRLWQPGDRFVPLGMKGGKKLSDFFTDAKLSLFEKQEQLLLCSANGDVAWVVGRRMDNRYRVAEKTARILRAKIELLGNR